MSFTQPALLAACYRNCLPLADHHGDVRRISFPSISTGVYGYPLEHAAPTALDAVRQYAEDHPDSAIEEVLFVLYDARTLAAYQSAYTLLP
jgi:O-acetyl-ADP-ribose deacetylase